MKDQDIELLSQYLDGELDVFSSRALEQRLTQDSALQHTLEQMRTQNDRLSRAFQPRGDVPSHIKDLLKPQSNVVSLPQRAPRPAWQYAVAASVIAAAGLVMAPQWQTADQGPQLASILEETPSMAEGWKTLADGSQVRPVLSFKATDGNWCREFLLSADDQNSRGVACRDAGEWQVEVLAQAELPGDAGHFRPAGAGDAEAVAEFLANHAQDVPLSSEQESKLIDKHWD